MVIRSVHASEKRAYFDLLWYCHPEPKPWHALEEQHFDPDETLVVTDEGDRIHTALQIRSFLMTYHGHSVPMGGIACVASSPDTRYQGHTGRLMEATIQRMHERGMVFSALAPFNYGFYRKYGWALSYEQMHYKVEMESLNKFLKTDYTYRMDVDHTAFMDLNNDFMAGFQGAVLHDKALLDRNLDALRAFDQHTCMCVNPQGEPEGYCFYMKQKRGDFIVRKMVWRTVSALKALLGFIYRHNAECNKVIIIVPEHNLLTDLLDEFQGEILHKPDMMMRVVDVKQALERRNYAADLRAQLSIHVDDPQAPWNHGTWLLTIRSGLGSAMRVDQDADASMDIKAFTQLMLGFRSAHTLWGLERIHTASAPMIHRLDEIFPSSHTYMGERF